MGGWVAGLAENKANSANPAELELGLSWAELGKSTFLSSYFFPTDRQTDILDYRGFYARG